jgi:outer membrane beta-barrel protein
MNKVLFMTKILFKSSMYLAFALLAKPATSATPTTNQSASSELTNQIQKLSGEAVSERFYVVQPRQSGTAGVFDLSAGGGSNLNSNVNVRSSEMGLRASYHASDRLFFSLGYSQVKNKFSESALRRIREDGIYPDVGFVKSRLDAGLGLNLIYGKARLTKDSVFYFNQYVSLGYGQIQQTDTITTVTTPAAVADVGVSCWFARTASLGLGFKNYYFREQRLASRGNVNHVVGYARLGVLIGGAG